MKLEQIKGHKTELARIAAKYGIRRVYLFGSVARGESTSTSDTDFLIELDDNASALGIGGFQYEAEQLLGGRVDVIPTFALQNHANREFAQNVQADVVPL